jgi:hypothetical protein
MWGSNPRPLAHKTNTLPTELMEHACHSWVPQCPTSIESRVRGLVVMIVACQVMDPGSIPGERIFCLLDSGLLDYVGVGETCSGQYARVHPCDKDKVVLSRKWWLAPSDSTISTVIHRFSSEHRS